LSVFGVVKMTVGCEYVIKTQNTFNHILHMKSEKKDIGRPYVRILESNGKLHPPFVLLLLQNYTIPLFPDTSQTGRRMGGGDCFQNFPTAVIKHVYTLFCVGKELASCLTPSPFQPVGEG
jgi:hypothetical protein